MEADLKVRLYECVNSHALSDCRLAPAEVGVFRARHLAVRHRADRRADLHLHVALDRRLRRAAVLLAPHEGDALAWLGLRTRSEGGRALVASVRSDGPAYTAGISAGDELLALDGWRIDEQRLAARVAERVPGDRVVLSLFRRDELLQLPVTLAAAPHDSLKLVRVEQPSDLQQRIYNGWLGR